MTVTKIVCPTNKKWLTLVIQ